MPEQDLYSELPRRPAWAALAGPAGMIAGIAVALILARLLEATVGSTAAVAGVVLLAVSAGVVAVALAVASRSGGAAPWQLGLDRLDIAGTLAWGAIIALPVVALAWAALAGTDARAAFDAPAQLLVAGPQAAFGSGEPKVVLDAGVVTSLLAVCVGPAIATELVLRGLAMPALSSSIGRLGAALVAALLTPAPFASLADQDQGGPVLAAALVGGLGISLVYLRTADLYPGIFAMALGLGLAMGMSMGWSVTGAAVLGLVSAALAIAGTRLLVAAWPARLAASNWGPAPGSAPFI